MILLNGRQTVLNAFESEIFPKRKQGKGFKDILDKVFHQKQLNILTPKQMLERLPITLAQVKTGNTSENLLNEIRVSWWPSG